MAEARWKHILDHEDLQRSSHVASVIGHNLYVFGGELVPREPRDEKVFSIDLDAAGMHRRFSSGNPNLAQNCPLSPRKLTLHPLLELVQHLQS